MDKKKKHSFKSRLRAFAIWQKLGYLPWRKRKEKKARKSGDFYRGAFDSIPFLNQDAERTFSHLLLRPGYMIRDYIKGDHERYLAPLTALIVFYAFFALVSAVMQPLGQQQRPKSPFHVDWGDVDIDVKMNGMNGDSFRVDEVNHPKAFQLLVNTLSIADKGWLYLHLDQYPEEVDTQHESSIAAFESSLRSQGIPLFLSQFFFLWLAMALALRRYKKGMSAYAAASAYILCQFSFFMLFALLLSFGKSGTIGPILMLILLVWDYHQWLGVGYKRSIRRAIATGINYGLLYVAAIFLVAAGSFLIAYFRT
jgi:hypothetical protein